MSEQKPLTCGLCGLDLHPGELGIRYFGTYAAHSEDRCIELLKLAHAETREQLENVDRMLRKSRIYCHIPPDEKACQENAAIEPEGERLRNELTDWLDRNGIVGVLMDTPSHYIDIGIAKLPPRIKTVLRLWGAISVVDGADSSALRAKPEPEQPKTVCVFCDCEVCECGY